MTTRSIRCLSLLHVACATASTIQFNVLTMHARAKKVLASSCRITATTIGKSCLDRSMNEHLDRIRSSRCCGKLVSFMWKNCRKDVALTFDFYTNSRSGCCSFEEVGLFGYSIRREHDTTSPGRRFRQRVFKYRLLDIDRSSTASDVRSVRQLIVSLFGGYIRGQEKSCSNEEESS